MLFFSPRPGILIPYTMKKTILIIDDDRKLQDLLEEYLSGYGFKVARCLDGASPADAIRSHAPALVILDIMLPVRDGFEVLKEIRSAGAIPVIMLTAKGEETDRILGLELGADDYLPKPFNPRELLARIKAVLRRSAGAAPGNMDAPLIACRGFELDLLKGSLSRSGAAADVSTTESALLSVLMRNSNRVVSRDDLMNAARGRDSIAFERSIDVHISKLRAKIAGISGERDVIKTVWGRGYMFVEKQ